MEETLRRSNMGRYAIVAAITPMIKTDAHIADDVAMSNAHSTGDGARGSATTPSSCRLLSLLSSDASLRNL